MVVEVWCGVAVAQGVVSVLLSTQGCRLRVIMGQVGVMRGGAGVDSQARMAPARQL